MSVRADGRAGSEPASDVAGEMAEARSEPDAGVNASSAELLSRYEQALARVDQLHRRLRQADRTLGEPADLHVDTDVETSDSPRPREARDAPTSRTPPEALKPKAPEAPRPRTPPKAPPAGPGQRASGGAPVQRVPGPRSQEQQRRVFSPDGQTTAVRSRPLVESLPAAPPDAREASRARRWQWAGIAGASLVVVMIAVAVLLPGPRAGVTEDAAVPEAGSPAEENASRAPAGEGWVGEAPTASTEEVPAETAPEPGSDAASEEWTLVRHVNAEAGYSFSYPESWRLDESGEVTTVSSPDGRYVVSFALGPRGPLDQTYDSFVALLERSYSEVEVTSRESVTATDGDALLIAGNAVNTSGSQVVFRALLVSASPERPTIGAIAATDSAGSFDERLVDVLASVEAA